MSDSEDNLFENQPFDEAMKIYFDYLIAKRDGNLRIINKLFKQYPDMFQTKTLKLAMKTAKRIAKLNNNKALLALLESKS